MFTNLKSSPYRGQQAAALSAAVAIALSGCAGALTGGPSVESGLVESSAVTPEAGEAFAFPELDGVPEESLDTLTAADPLAEVVAQWGLREKVASLFLIHLPGADPAVHQQVLAQEPIAGFLLLADNISGSAESTREFVASVRDAGDIDLLMAVDQEGGSVQRLGADDFPAPTELAEADPSATTDATRQRNQLVFDAGANVNLGVVADVSPGDEAYIHPRSFGTNPESVTERVLAALRGEVEGVAIAVKHFPGHGMTLEDTHETLGVGSVDFDQWRNDHGAPFQAAIDRAVPMVMTGHLVLPAVDDLPASVSERWVDLLRNQWGYQGVIVTDDLAMLEDSGDDRFQDPSANVVFALQAGADLVIDSGGVSARATRERLTASIDAVVEAIERGEISEASIEQSALRVLRLRESLGGVVRPLEDAEVGELDG